MPLIENFTLGLSKFLALFNATFLDITLAVCDNLKVKYANLYEVHITLNLKISHLDIYYGDTSQMTPGCEIDNAHKVGWKNKVR